MERPNILIIHTDQQRWDTCAANRNNLIKTPNIDRLASTGVNFDSCFAQNPVCMPSRVSLLTGQYCSALRISHMAVTVPEDTVTLQMILSRYGYYNALIGKLHFLPHSNRKHNDLHPSYDFDHLELSDEPGCYDDAYRAWVRRKAPDELAHISLGLPPVTEQWQRLVGFRDGIPHADRMQYRGIAHPARSDTTQAAFVGEQTSEFIRRNRDKPFFCFSGFYSPHSPWVAPEEYLDLYREEDMPLPHYPEGYPESDEERFSPETLRSITRGYYAMISEVDYWIGSILDALDDAGIRDNTIILFTSDHGEWLGEHRRFGKGYWAPDVVSRVPLIVSVPEALGGIAGETVRDIVECVDVVPTVLDLAGIPAPSQVQGDLLDVSHGSEAGDGDGYGLTEHRGWKSLRTPTHRYVAEATGDEYLYDLTTDPWEYQDIAHDSGSVDALAECRHALISRMMSIEQPHELEWPY
jgi:arylsulfatase